MNICYKLLTHVTIINNLLTGTYLFQFDMWTDSQRKRFFDLIFRQCSRRQNKFVQDWFEERVPLQHLDFSTVLPRLLALYVFSYLEPISMSRCAQVCWHWKFLAEQVLHGFHLSPAPHTTNLQKTTLKSSQQ